MRLTRPGRGRVGGGSAAESTQLVEAVALDDGMLWLRDGSARAALEVRPLSLLLRRPEEQADVYRSYRQWLDGLTVPVSVHLVTQTVDPAPLAAHYRRCAARALTPALGPWIREEAQVVAAHLAERQLLEARFVVVVATAAPLVHPPALWRRLVAHRGDAAPATERGPRTGSAAQRELNERCATLRDGLRRVGLRAERLEDAAWFDMLQQAQGGRSGGEPATLAAWLAPAHMRVRADHLVVNDGYCRSLVVTGYPRTVRMGWLGPLLGGLGHPMRIALHIRPLPKAVVLGHLRRKIRGFETTAVVDGLQGRRTDSGTRTVLADATRLEEQVLLDEERLFHLEVDATVSAPTLGELGERCTALTARLAELGCHASWLRHRQVDGWRATLPLGASPLGWVRDLPSSALATTFPFLRNGLPTSNGVLLGTNLLESGLVFVDPFAPSHPNANAILVGTSGAGKSYTAKLLLAKCAAEGVHVRCIDPADEYRAVTTGLGGEYLTIGLGSPTRLNPLDLHGVPGTDPVAIQRDKVAQLLPILTLLVGRPAGDGSSPVLRPGEVAALEAALLHLYARAGIPGATQDVDPRAQPRLQDLSGRLEATGPRGLAARLRRYTEGAYGSLLDQPTTVRLDAPIVTFGVRSLAAYGDTLLPAVIAMLLGHLQGELHRCPGPRRLLVVDEAEVLLRHRPSAVALEGMSRRVRKYGAGLLVISQVVEDLLDSPSGNVIMRNSHLKLLLRQEPVALPQVASAFGLSRGAADILEQASPGCGLVVLGADQAAVRGLASPQLHRWITTHPAEIAETP
ncbi:MAG TPA: DUF87 domain-containing protein [Verrucomicrobiae bacterium]|nr:DUF87 domain-containing protein [Verrucomicrobiae bacterium]